MTNQQQSSKLSVIVRSAMYAIYELLFACIPVFVWISVLWATAPASDEYRRLPAWAFLAVSLWANTLKDGVKLFNRRNNFHDAYQAELLVSVCVTGLIISSVLLCLGVLKSRGLLSHLWGFYYFSVDALFWAGLALLWLVKAVKFQREHDVYI